MSKNVNNDVSKDPLIKSIFYFIFISTVRPTDHTNPSRKLEDLKMPALHFSAEFFENDDVMT